MRDQIMIKNPIEKKFVFFKKDLDLATRIPQVDHFNSMGLQLYG